MKVVAISGSARHDGNTSILIKKAFEEMEAEGIQTELIQLAGKPVRGCTACYECFNKKNKRCVIDDEINNCIEKMVAADGIIIASPVYFADISSETKALIDRAGMVARANNQLFALKVGAAIVAVRRAGAIHAFDSINHFFFISEMIVPGSSYWNIGMGRQIGEVENDSEGIQTMTTLGRNFSWVLKKLNA